MLSAPDRPTGIVCGNDEIALQAYCAALQLGLRIPDDISIIGFDDFEAVSLVLRPALTTIMALPYHQMGARAVEILIGQMRAPPPEVPRVSCRCLLMNRESVLVLPARLF